MKDRLESCWYTGKNVGEHYRHDDHPTAASETKQASRISIKEQPTLNPNP